MKRVLVTGASGFLGAVVAETLAHTGYTVVGAYHTPDSVLPIHGVQETSLDLASEGDWAGLPDNIDAIIHCAALVPSRFSNDASMIETLWRVNSLGTLKLLNWAQENGVGQFVYCSSHAIYRRPVPCPVTEEHAVYPSGKAAFYAMSKLAGEISASHMRSDSFNVCSLRLSSLYGARMKKSGVLYRFVAEAKAGRALKITSCPDSSFDFLYVQDAAEAIRLCLVTSSSQPCLGGFP